MFALYTHINSLYKKLSANIWGLISPGNYFFFTLCFQSQTFACASVGGIALSLDTSEMEVHFHMKQVHFKKPNTSHGTIHSIYFRHLF